MKIDYTKLFEKLKKENITQKEFRKNIGIGGTTMSSLINNDSVTIDTICRICDYLHCIPDEIMEWIPDAEYEKANAEKAEIQAQINELQKKLKNI